MKSKASETASKRTTATSKPSPNRKTSKKAKQADPLASCPVDGAGWCPYPFSIAQLKKRLKAKAAGA